MPKGLVGLDLVNAADENRKKERQLREQFNDGRDLTVADTALYRISSLRLKLQGNEMQQLIALEGTDANFHDMGMDYNRVKDNKKLFGTAVEDLLFMSFNQADSFKDADENADNKAMASRMASEIANALTSENEALYGPISKEEKLASLDILEEKYREQCEFQPFMPDAPSEEEISATTEYIRGIKDKVKEGKIAAKVQKVEEIKEEPKQYVKEEKVEKAEAAADNEAEIIAEEKPREELNSKEADQKISVDAAEVNRREALNSLDNIDPGVKKFYEQKIMLEKLSGYAAMNLEVDGKSFDRIHDGRVRNVFHENFNEAKNQDGLKLETAEKFRKAIMESNRSLYGSVPNRERFQNLKDLYEEFSNFSDNPEDKLKLAQSVMNDMDKIKVSWFGSFGSEKSAARKEQQAVLKDMEKRILDLKKQIQEKKPEQKEEQKDDSMDIAPRRPSNAVKTNVSDLKEKLDGEKSKKDSTVKKEREHSVQKSNVKAKTK